MIRSTIIIGILLTFATCASDEDSNSNIDLSDSALATLPDWVAYYCDTTKVTLDSLPCIEAFTRKMTRHNGYYVVTEQNIGTSTSGINDTFFITQTGSWYQKHNGSWNLFFSQTSFSSKMKTTLQRNAFQTSNLEEWIPDSQYISSKYGRMYVFKLKFPLSSDPEEIAVHFSQYYGYVHIVSQQHVLSINRIDSIK